MRILEQLKARQQSSREQAVKTIREIAARAAEDNPRKGDDEALYKALAEAGMSTEQFAAMATDLRELDDLRRTASSIERVEHELSQAFERVRQHDADTDKLVAQRKRERDKIDANRVSLDSELRQARKAASAANAIEAKHPGWIEPAVADLDGYILACREDVTSHNVKGAPKLDVCVDTLRRHSSLRWACITVAWVEDVKAGAIARRQWEIRNERELTAIGRLRHESDQLAMAGMGGGGNGQQIQTLQAALSLAPPRDIPMPEWHNLVADQKRLNAIKARIAGEIETPIEQATVQQLDKVTRKYEDARCTNGWKEL